MTRIVFGLTAAAALFAGQAAFAGGQINAAQPGVSASVQAGQTVSTTSTGNIGGGSIAPGRTITLTLTLPGGFSSSFGGQQPSNTIAGLVGEFSQLPVQFTAQQTGSINF